MGQLWPVLKVFMISFAGFSIFFRFIVAVPLKLIKILCSKVFILYYLTKENKVARITLQTGQLWPPVQ